MASAQALYCLGLLQGALRDITEINWMYPPSRLYQFCAQGASITYELALQCKTCRK